MKQKNQSVSRSDQINRLDYIDSLRGFAILGVVAFHSAVNFQTFNPFWFGQIVSQGARGVQLFYLLSALTLALSFSRRSKLEKHAVRNFYIRRFFRIAPLFYLAIFYYLGYYFFFENRIFSLASILTTFSFINGISPYWINDIIVGGWSIAVEMTFYLVFPFLFIYLNSFKKAVGLTIIFLISMQMLRLFLLTNPFIPEQSIWQEFTFLFFPSQLPVFLMGILAFYLIKKQDFSMLVKIYVLLFFTLLLQYFFTIPIVAGHYIYGFIFLGVCVFLAKYPVKILVNPIICFIGMISFSLYLSHIAVLHLLQLIGLFNLFPQFSIANYFVNFILIFGFSILVSVVLYRLVEQPGQNLGKKIIHHFEW